LDADHYEVGMTRASGTATASGLES